MMYWTEAIPFFKKYELACQGSGVVKLDIRFAAALPALRLAWGESVTPNSVCRSPEHNRAEDGHPNSLHLTENPKWPTHGCMAMDWPWRDWHRMKKLRLARLAWDMGWSVGLHDGFCHIDRRADMKLPELPQKVFLYGEWSNEFSPDDVVGEDFI